MNKLIPPGLPASKIFTHLAEFNQADLVEDLANNGFELIELGGDLSIFLPHTFEEEAIQQLTRIKEDQDLSYTIHLPLWSVEPSTPLEPVRRGSIRALIDIVNATQCLDPEIYVIHATGALAAEFYRMRLPEVAKIIILRQFQNAARESLKILLYETGLSSRRLAVETVEFPFDLTFELAEDLDLAICLDTGHLLVGFSGPITLTEALKRSLPRLGEIHLHDGPWQGHERQIGYGQDHQPLGAGDLDIKKFITQLKNNNFNGPVIFELSVEDAITSLEKIRNLTIN